MRSRDIRRRLECADHLIERRLQQRRVGLDRNQQWPGRLKQYSGDGIRPRRRSRRHSRNAGERPEARGRLRIPHGHIRIRHMARRLVLRHMDRTTDVVGVGLPLRFGIAIRRR